MTRPHIHTIHHHPITHRHFGWDNSLTPTHRAAPGDTLTFTIQDASGGQLNEHSTSADVPNFDFSLTNPVNGPVYIEGAEPGDALCVEILDFQESAQSSSAWGWTGILPGFGLLAASTTVLCACDLMLAFTPTAARSCCKLWAIRG